MPLPAPNRGIPTRPSCLRQDIPEVWLKGWKRIALFANFFMPGSLVELPNSVWAAAAPKSPMPELGWAGVLPFAWRSSTDAAFEAFAAEGKPSVAPIIQIMWADTESSPLPLNSA